MSRQETNWLFEKYDDEFGDVKITPEVPLNSGARFSECRKFRYALWRTWECDAPVVAFIGVNPSIASETQDDNTIKSCCRWAKFHSFGGILMLNAFAFVQTKLGNLKLDREHVGPINDEIILEYHKKGTTIIAAWGNHCPFWRSKELASLIGRELMCLGYNDNGSPKHPLFMRADTGLVHFKT